MTEEVRPARGLEDYVAELAAGGRQLAEPGRFDVDLEAAREKLARFRLPDPHYYIAELVRAAVIRRATAIDVEVTAGEARVSFDGEAFTTDDLGQLHPALLSTGEEARTRALRHLAIGVHVALSLEPDAVVVASRPRQGEGTRLTLRPGGEVSAEAVAAHLDGEIPAGRTSITVTRRGRWNRMRAAVVELASELPEEQVVRERCRFCSVPVTLDGTRITADPPVPDLVARRRRVTGEMAVDGGFSLSASAPTTTVHHVKDGVLVTTESLSEGRPAGFVAVAESEETTLDLSLGDIVRDEAYDRVMAEVDRTRQAATSRLIALVSDWRSEAPQAADWAERALRALFAEPDLARALHAKLVTARIWPTVDGLPGYPREGPTLVSAAQLVRPAGKYEVSYLAAAVERYAASVRRRAQLADICLVLPLEKPRAALAAHLGVSFTPLASGTDAVDADVVRATTPYSRRTIAIAAAVLLLIAGLVTWVLHDASEPDEEFPFSMAVTGEQPRPVPNDPFGALGWYFERCVEVSRKDACAEEARLYRSLSPATRSRLLQSEVRRCRREDGLAKGCLSSGVRLRFDPTQAEHFVLGRDALVLACNAGQEVACLLRSTDGAETAFGFIAERRARARAKCNARAEIDRWDCATYESRPSTPVHRWIDQEVDRFCAGGSALACYHLGLLRAWRYPQTADVVRAAKSRLAEACRRGARPACEIPAWMKLSKDAW